MQMNSLNGVINLKRKMMWWHQGGIWIIPRVTAGIEVVKVMGVGGKPASEDEYIPNICS